MKRNGQKRRRQSRNWKKVRAHLENQVDTDCWLEIIRRYTEISERDKTILFGLVDRIEAGDTQKVNGQRICEVKVYCRYAPAPPFWIQFLLTFG